MPLEHAGKDAINVNEYPHHPSLISHRHDLQRSLMQQLREPRV
jgi:hypothetical protein